MKTRMLGHELTVSSIGFGAMGLSNFYGDSNDQNSLDVLHEAVDTGITFFDTADFYGQGHNEKLLGNFISKLPMSQRQYLVIATKCGIELNNENKNQRKINNSPAYMRQCCENSLKRLGVECIDLFYLHRVDPDRPIDESISCLKDLVNEGKIRYIGLSEVSAKTLIEAHAVHPITALQTEYSFWTRDIEDNILPTALELGIGIVPYSPLGRGFLSGQYLSYDVFQPNDFRRKNPRFKPDNIKHNAGLLDILTPIAEKYECTLAQLSLAWILSQDPSIVPIPGTKRISHLRENIGSIDINLEDSDLNYLNEYSRNFKIMGARYTEEGMKGINS